MRPFISLFFVLLATSSAFADPQSFVTSSLKRVENHDVFLSGNLARAARERAAFFKAACTGGSATAPITNQLAFYTASINIGSPSTSYDLLVDSGSSNTWIGYGKSYRRTSTSIATGQRFDILYGSGAAAGIEYLDQVNVADGLTITNQSIGDATLTAGIPSPANGILGLGPIDLTNATMSPDRGLTPTVLDNLVSQKLIEQQILGVYFVPSSATTNETDGSLTYGGYDSTLFEGELGYTPFTTVAPSSTFWGINITTATYGKIKVIPESAAGIVDTGTTLILMADDFFETYANAIPGSFINSSLGVLQIPPDAVDQMQPLHVTIGDTLFILDVEAQLLPESLSTAIGGIPGFRYGALNPTGYLHGDSIDFILGMAWIERFYTVIDAVDKRIGFATTKHTYTT